ncbi:MAG: PKD domain-containing protein, partial [Bacteroidia bacterium]
MNKSLVFLLFLLPSLVAYGQCDATFSVAPGDSLCPGEVFTFTANANPGVATTYVWDFGDGNTATGQTATHAYGFNAVASTFTASLTVTDTIGALPCSQTRTITVPATPSVSVTSTSSNFCTGDTTISQFTVFYTIDTSQTPLSAGPFTWDFGDGTVVTTSLDTISHTLNCFGTYDTKLFLPGSTCPSYTQIKTFYRQPRSGIGFPANDACEGAPITVLNLSDTLSCNNIDYYEWDWGANGPTYNVTTNDDQTYTFNIDSATTCSPNLGFFGISDVVKITAFNACLATGHFSTTQITIQPKPIAFFPPIDTLCFPGTTTITPLNESCPNPTFGYSDLPTFRWTFGEPSLGAADTSLLSSPAHTYGAPGKYTITLIATNSCGADTFSREVVVIEAPTVFAAADTNQVCAGGCVNYTNFTIPDTAIARTDFQWTITPNNGFSFPMGSSATQHSPTICFNQPGTYFVQLRAENVCGVGFWLDTITVFTRPTLALDTLVDTCGVFILDTLSYTFNDNGAPIQNFNWQFLGGVPATFNG